MPSSGVTLGSPPRVRGKGLDRPLSDLRHGITPACAGKRFMLNPCGLYLRDHPRVCGEKEIAAGRDVAYWGSPPRMRGKVDESGHENVEVRITPAYAGKSCPRHRPQRLRRDHPRVCGEKILDFALVIQLQGSPPRMRGKALRRCTQCRRGGITPAYAGKRCTQSLSGMPAGDHPRVCGEKS